MSGDHPDKSRTIARSIRRGHDVHKRIGLIAIAFVALFALAACGSSTNKTNHEGDGQTPTGQSTTEQPQQQEQAPAKLVVGFVPSQEAENLDAKAKPLADLLTDKLGVPVEVFVGSDYTALIEAMGAGKVDIGFLNPQGYVLAKDRGYADVLLKAVRHGSDSYRAQFVVLKDSPIQSIADLKGKKIAFVDPASTSGYVYPVVLLKKNGIDPEKDITPIMSGGHDKAILALLRGDADVAVSFDDARTIVEKTDPDVMNKTRILTYTDNIPNDTVSVRSSLPEAWKEKIKAAFLGIAEDEHGKQIIQDIYSHDGYTEAKDSDFDVVREANRLMGQ
ncbi:MAG: phosphate/phosphite/phosphonate ABC transporter substrate-binding protein [Hydrogenibacillus sp.]|nr:phosphate/phosphite/phosphonate ABC transporter substrate-binding protein [Hydrogenibacillus sp.]